MNIRKIMDIVQPSTPLPPWFSEEDLAAYGALYEKSGFRTALQVPHRISLHEQANIKDPRVHVPALFIAGQKDYFLKFLGVQDYISGGLKSLAPNLQMVSLPEGTHFVQEQLPDDVNRLLLDFLTKNSQS